MRASLSAKAIAATLLWCASCELGQPRTQTGKFFALCCRTARAPCTKRPRKYEFPRLLIPSSFCCSSGRVARDDSEPRGKPTPLFESGSIADRGDDCSRRDRSDARNLDQPLAGFVLASSLVDHRIDFVDPHLQVFEFSLQLRQQHAQCARELGAGVFHDPGQCGIDMASPLAQSDSTFEQQATIRLMSAVRRITQRSRTRCRDCRSSWSSLLIGTKRIFGRSTASAIASASM